MKILFSVAVEEVSDDGGLGLITNCVLNQSSTANGIGMGAESFSSCIRQKDENLWLRINIKTLISSLRVIYFHI